jgi:peptidoglycan/LPS O-acetylase OafA/YrhL
VSSVASPSGKALAQLAPVIKGRIPSLDGLRALSILLVLLGHTAMSDRAPWILQSFTHVGNVGVRFFFIISGFLITTLLLKEQQKFGRISLPRFYLRRALRIFPAMYTLVLIMVILDVFKLIHLKSGEALYAATFTMNYHDVKLFWLGQLWSLSVEEQFYLLWPGLLIMAGIRRSFRAAWFIVFASLLTRFLMWHFWHASETAMTKHFESNADALAIGCLMSANFNRLGQSTLYLRMQAKATGFLGLALMIVAIANALYLVRPGLFYVWGQSLANIGIAMLIDWAIRNPGRLVGRLLNWPPLVFVGTLSYSLYLWQNPFLLGDAGSRWNVYPLNVACAFTVAVLSYFLVERPFLSLRISLGSRARIVAPEREK